MGTQKVLYFSLLQIVFMSLVCVTRSNNCEIETEYSGDIYLNTYRNNEGCWTIKVPDNSYVRLNVTELYVYNSECYYNRVEINVAGTDEKFQFCQYDINPKPVIALNDVDIGYYTNGNRISFRIHYHTESLICAQKKHFRCSTHYCIHQNQVCDEVKDCENGIDEKGCEKGVNAVSGVNISRQNLITELWSQWSVSSGWGRNTHRAITALYLAGAAVFGGEDTEAELVAKQLELQTSVALLRNFSDVLSVSELSMFINALTVTCHNPRHFYGYDLLQILGERVAASESPSPAAYLTLCNGNWTFTEPHVQNLLRILHAHSEYPFHLDVQAMTVMVLACLRNKANIFEDVQNATELYNSTVQKFIDSQLHDGSFGNIYTTALVTQALLSSGQENNKLWKLNSTLKYIMKELNTSDDFLSSYLALPIFSGKSLVDITKVNCTNLRKHGEDEAISDVTNKLVGKVRVQYSLYVGDQKDVIHTIYLRVPGNSSAYDVMRLAQVVDHKYKFQHSYVSRRMYLYTIAGITNDPEADKFWLLYTEDSSMNGTVHPHTKSPDEFILEDGEHLIMWYRTAYI